MGVQFAMSAVTARMEGTEFIPAWEETGDNLPALFSKKIVREVRAKKNYYPVPDGRPMWIPMGDEGPTVKMQAFFAPGETLGDFVYAYDAWEVVRGNTLLTVIDNTIGADGLPGGESAAEYYELPMDSQWYVDSLILDRGVGMMKRWDIELVLTRNWFGIDGTPLE